MEKLERKRKARDVQYQLQQIMEDKDIGEKDKEPPEGDPESKEGGNKPGKTDNFPKPSTTDSGGQR